MQSPAHTSRHKTNWRILIRHRCDAIAGDGARHPFIEVVCPVDEKGRFTSEVPERQGLQVFEANKPILQTLKQRGLLVRHDTIVHNYPHCWRTDTPLI